jgi:hypothetical protein
MVFTNSTKLNGLVEIIADGKEFFVRKLNIISLIMFYGTVSSGKYFSNAIFDNNVSVIVKSFMRWTYM